MNIIWILVLTLFFCILFWGVRTYCMKLKLQENHKEVIEFINSSSTKVGDCRSYVIISYGYSMNTINVEYIQKYLREEYEGNREFTFDGCAVPGELTYLLKRVK